MYFYQISGTSDYTPQLRGGVSLNEISETSLDRLGWFRWENGNWNIRKGLVKITQAQVFFTQILNLNFTACPCTRLQGTTIHIVVQCRTTGNLC